MSTTPHADVSPPLRVDEFVELQEALTSVSTRAVGAPSTSVTIGVSGGAPSERYMFMVRVNGKGEGRFRFLDEVAGREVKEADFSVSAPQTARIFGMLRPIVEPGPKRLFEPDSLVGFVTIRAGKLESQLVFPVREAGADDAANEMVTLAGADDWLRIDPQEVPKGLTDLFAEMSSLVHERA